MSKNQTEVPHHAVRTFECSCADTQEQVRELKSKKNTPLLRCESRVHDAEYGLVEYYVALIKGKYTVQE